MNFHDLNKIITETPNFLRMPGQDSSQVVQGQMPGQGSTPLTSNASLEKPGSTQQADPGSPDQAGPDPRTARDTSSLLNKISKKTGEHSGKYRPLIAFVGRNPAMLALFNDMLDSAGAMQQSTFKNL